MNKKSTDDTQSNKNIFNILVENAFEFFEDALKNIEKKPKHSLIFFYTAIELIFKARLALVDPMWIIEEPSCASDKLFCSGNFKSVGLKTAYNRLKMLNPEEEIDESILAIFNRLRRHRNRIIHYAIDMSRETEKVAKDLFLGWYNIHLLFQGQWHSIFAKYKNKIDGIDHRLIKTKPYLHHIYSVEKKNCGTCMKCECCGYKAFNGKVCKVCGYRVPASKDDLLKTLSACCGKCYGYETAKRTEYGFHCTECGHNFKGYKIVNCEYCNQAWVGLDEDPDYLGGCEHCEGGLRQD